MILMNLGIDAFLCDSSLDDSIVEGEKGPRVDRMLSDLQVASPLYLNPLREGRMAIMW